MKRTHREAAQTSRSQVTLYCEVLQGLKAFALKELIARFGKYISLIPYESEEALIINYTGSLHDLMRLRTVVAVYLMQQFAITRPRALLGHQNYQVLLQQIKRVRELHVPHAFAGLRISAAGGDSSVFTTLKEQLCEDTGLSYDSEEGDLLLRIRPSTLVGEGWEVLTRLSPRPLATRAWRAYNMKGALNATIAAAMIEMTEPRPHDRFLNLMCGSGTLLIERLLRESVAQAVGCDVDLRALAGAQQNLEVGRVARNVLLFSADATQLPFLPGTFDVICADLPWGQLVGSHEQNVDLYPRIFEEAARLAIPGARFVLVTHEIALFEEVTQRYTDVWEVQEVIKVFQGGLHPRIYLFQRL